LGGRHHHAAPLGRLPFRTKITDCQRSRQYRALARLFGAGRPGKCAHHSPREEIDMRPILDVILILLDMYMYVVIAAVILSWLIAFNVINTRNQIVAMIADFLYRVTEPVFRPIRNFLPNLGGIDFSPLIVLLIIYVIRRYISDYIYPLVP
jgi:YggT family protein